MWVKKRKWLESIILTLLTGIANLWDMKNMWTDLTVSLRSIQRERDLLSQSPSCLWLLRSMNAALPRLHQVARGYGSSSAGLGKLLNVGWICALQNPTVRPTYTWPQSKFSRPRRAIRRQGWKEGNRYAMNEDWRNNPACGGYHYSNLLISSFHPLSLTAFPKGQSAQYMAN